MIKDMKTVLFVWYPKCSTCQKAKRWLDENGVSYQERHIVEERPTAGELAQRPAAQALFQHQRHAL